MIHALITGKLHADPVERTGKNERPFVTVKATVPAGGGRIFANVIAFDNVAMTALMALSTGDAVSIAGELTPTAWTDKEGTAKPSIDVVAHQVLSVYAVRQRKQAAQPQSQGHAAPPRNNPVQAMDDARATWGHHPDDVGF